MPHADVASIEVQRAYRLSPALNPGERPAPLPLWRQGCQANWRQRPRLLITDGSDIPTIWPTGRLYWRGEQLVGNIRLSAIAATAFWRGSRGSDAVDRFGG